MRAHEFGEKNDFAGEAVWRKIMAAAGELLKAQPDREMYQSRR